MSSGVGKKKRSRSGGKSKHRSSKKMSKSSYRNDKDRALDVLNRRVGGFLGIEKKFYDTYRIAAQVTNALLWFGCEYDPAPLCLNAPAQGAGPQQREGRKITCSSIQVRGQLMLPGYTGATYPTAGACTVFVALLMDTQSNGSQFNSEDVYVNPAGSIAGGVCPLRNLETGKRFKVLKTQTFDLSNMASIAIAGANFVGEPVSTTFDWFVPLDFVTSFNASAVEGVVNVMDNSLHIVANSTYSSTGLYTPELTYNARLRFLG